MKFGYFGLNMGPFCDAGRMASLVSLSEEAGFESIWTGEHVVLIDPQAPPSPASPKTPFLDSVAALAFAAAHSKKLLLGSGIILLPQRNPVVLAKELAGVDVLSGGRLLFGAGVGYVPGEYETLGIPTWATTLNSRRMRSTRTSRCSSPMPEMIVWPVSSFTVTKNVGSSSASFRRASVRRS